ncbi:lysophospholipid acyltransferase family protein [Massilia aerilata]|uniref:Lysophospholipid acyltransferase family protein n=1 Tax=Massilia aerilata TaxID=453817 RepID=A0ABW0S784_9BURK
MTLRVAARLLRVLAHLLLGLGICALLFPWLGRERRMRRIRRWSMQLLRIFGVRAALADGAGAGRGLWVANHVSWIDIFVINALFPSRFVAKSEVRRWPLVGPLCAWAGTIFIQRANPRDLRQTMAVMVAALRDGERVVVFPEGTSAAQGRVLPFRANLFEAAIEAGVPVQPVSIRYLDPEGRFHGAVEYIGTTSLLESMVAILSGGPVHARLAVLPAFEAGGADRRTLAQSAHRAVADELALPSSASAARP